MGSKLPLAVRTEGSLSLATGDLEVIVEAPPGIPYDDPNRTSDYLPQLTIVLVLQGNCWLAQRKTVTIRANKTTTLNLRTYCSYG